MKDEKELNMHVQTDDLAVPEVIVNEEEDNKKKVNTISSNSEDDFEDETDEDSIDYSGAIPQIHIKKK